jgi:hypothetical protein
MLKATTLTIHLRDSTILHLCFFAQKMEMAIDFVKTQSFLGNLAHAFVVDGLMAYGFF